MLARQQCKSLVRIGDKNKAKSSSDTELGSENQTGPPLPPRDDIKVKEKGSLNELIASIKVTCELVAHMAQELKHQESEDGKNGEMSSQPTQTLDELYMETMKPLQFGKAFVTCMECEGDIAQLVEHLLCMQGALGSIPSISNFFIQFNFLCGQSTCKGFSVKSFSTF